MTIRLFCLAVMLLLGACSFHPGSEARQQAAPLSGTLVVHAPNWKPGSQWEYDDGYGLKVTRTDGELATFQRLDDPQQWVVRRGFLREDAQSATTFRKLLFENLPVGNGLVLSSRAPVTYQREYQAGNVRHSHVTSWAVEGRETVKVPAGDFDCVILVMRTRNLSDGWSGFERWWFSPRAQHYVRLDFRYGNAPEGSRVLTRYRLIGQGSTAPPP